MTVSLIIQTDGASRGNPGPSGIGIVIRDSKGQYLSRISRYLGAATNNQAEYAAVVAGLEEALPHQPDHIDLYVDSELVARQLQGSYRVRNEHLRPLFQRSSELLRRFPSARVHSVPRESNREADALANRAIDEANPRY